MRNFFLLLLVVGVMVGGWQPCHGARSTPLIIDHNNTNLWQVPESAIILAKEKLHIAYGHTSHGSQLIAGMGGASNQLDVFMSSNGATSGVYIWNDGPLQGALDLDDYAMGGDVGYYPQWLNNTRAYLGDPDPATGRGTSHSDVNVIIWSWCGQASGRTEETMISTYLQPMSELEEDYPGIVFIYMAGHLDGGGATGNLHLRNEQIRTYCRENNKVLYDFADIESYDPDGLVNYMELMGNDNCDYDNDGNGSRESNWALDWQDNHTEGVDWWISGAAHSQHLNGNRKGYAAWWLWASLAGWNDPDGAVEHAIAILQSQTGATPDLSNVGPDINGDSHIGVVEAINMLRVSAGLE
ncbi:hypothetical protein [Desulfopila sp. IMCC35008]|uniref:hypothetical protein n=1 Tax=Desulfopila sp. IMCC35008 TaxID=2653858 RepID=UPI0013D709AC|nr:hypothetical protein [Desulfopila sp. IMCC35008]